MQIEMSIKGLMVDPVTNMPIVILRDKDGQRVLPIWVGIFEANAIALQIENVSTPRPMTHDLLRNVIYDLKASVQKILEGGTRQEQRAFIALRSHYLFESHFCTPGQGNQKGGVEHAVGFGRRNFLVPIPQVASFAELNALLLRRCQENDARQVDGQAVTIAEAWAVERPVLRALPGKDHACCVSKPVALTPYSQVEFDGNRYSVPANKVEAHLVVKAYPFRVDVLYLDDVIASHPRCYGKNEDIYDPLHYLPLLEQRPGAFQHAKPLRRWRAAWPPVYEQLLTRLQAEGDGIREFVRILGLHQEYPAPLIEQAVTQALAYGCLHLDGITLCLRQIMHPAPALPALDLTEHPHLGIAIELPDVRRYVYLSSEKGTT